MKVSKPQVTHGFRKFGPKSIKHVMLVNDGWPLMSQSVMRHNSDIHLNATRSFSYHMRDSLFGPKNRQASIHK